MGEFGVTSNFAFYRGDPCCTAICPPRQGQCGGGPASGVHPWDISVLLHPLSQGMCLYSARPGQREEEPHPASWAPPRACAEPEGAARQGRVPDVGSLVSLIQTCQLLDEGLAPAGYPVRGHSFHKSSLPSLPGSWPNGHFLCTPTPCRRQLEPLFVLAPILSQMCVVQTLEPDRHRSNPSFTAFRLCSPRRGDFPSLNCPNWESRSWSPARRGCCED